MQSLSQHIHEALITLAKGKKSQFGNIVIFAGGSGSGKGWVRSNLLDIEGNVLDIDDFKDLAISSFRIAQLAKEITGKDITKLDLSNPDDNTELHNILINRLRLKEKLYDTVYKQVLVHDESRKPNLIFDVTLQSIRQFEEICRFSKALGYSTDNMHLVWVLNDLEISSQQNANRDRVIDDIILRDIHERVAITMTKVIEYSESLEYLLNGKIIINFNQINVDTKVLKSTFGGSYVKKANYLTIKEALKSIDRTKITAEILDKIDKYTKGFFRLSK